jgi:cell division protein FtsB
VIRTPSAQGMNLGVTKVERLNRQRDTGTRRFVMTPDWGRRKVETPEVEIPELKNPRLEARRKAKEEAQAKEKTKLREKQETVLTPTLPQGQPKLRGVNILLTVLAVTGCIHIMVMMGIELNRMVASQQEITRLTAETQVLEAEVTGLQSVLDNANNPEFREQLARRAGFAYSDEARYLSVPNTPEQSATSNQP